MDKLVISREIPEIHGHLNAPLIFFMNQFPIMVELLNSSKTCWDFHIINQIWGFKMNLSSQKVNLILGFEFTITKQFLHKIRIFFNRMPNKKVWMLKIHERIKVFI